MLSPKNTDRLKIVLLGYLVRGPIGGMAWHHLNYALGLMKLGHEVLFLEDSDDYASCYDPTTHEIGTSPKFGIDFADDVFKRLGMGDVWSFYDAHTQRWLGPAQERAVPFCQSADIVINVSGVNPLRPWLTEIPRRAFIDTDPTFTQVKNLTDESFRSRVAGHTIHFSFGELIETGETTVPNDGIRWLPTRQPIALDAWPAATPQGTRYTTVMQWQSYPPVEYAGRRLGAKQESFDIIEILPQRVETELEIALGSASAPRERLKALGWHLRDPIQAAPDPWRYQQYLRESRGEVSVAKQGYAATHCGWFSERSACYLATGRPVVVQDTGFSQLLPVGSGLHAFANAQEAVDAISSIESDYSTHCRSARQIAEEYFDSDKVLTSLLQSIINN